MTVYSYSRINSFFTCPAQFEFRYIKRTPSPVAEGIELFLGSRFHETMEHLYGLVPERVPTVNELMDFFKRHWADHWQKALLNQKNKGFSEALRITHEGQTVQDYFQKGQLFVENYYHNYQPFDQDVTEGIEMKVMFNLDAKGEYKMQGYIDRLGRDAEGTFLIHDYKTSSRKMSQEDVKFEDQLALYQAGLAQDPKFGPKARFKQVWHFVAFEKDQVVDERGPGEIAKLKDRTIAKIQTIERSKNYPTKPGVLCGWCEFLSLCPTGQQAVAERKKKKGEGASSAPALSEKAIPSVVVGTVNSSAIPTPVLEKGKAPSVEPDPPKPAKKKVKGAVSPDQLSFFG